MKVSKKEMERIRKTVKCNCGHYFKNHHLFMGMGGWCKKCGCTWYYPNDKYIIRKSKEKKLQAKKMKEK